jgi:putative intracellular protease/amidase
MDASAPGSKGKVGVLIENHFDPTEYIEFNKFFPAHGYGVEYLTHLWGQPSLRFYADPEDDGTFKCGPVDVNIEVTHATPSDYRGIILIGAYAMDRLRYQESITPGEPNSAPAVVFLRRCMATKGLKIGTICHSMWLLCADRTLLKGRRVTCAHNIVCDVEAAGATIVYDGKQTAEVVVDEDLISGRHPGVVQAFMDRFLAELDRVPATAA